LANRAALPAHWQAIATGDDGAHGKKGSDDSEQYFCV
jgi:hypothetical protein